MTVHHFPRKDYLWEMVDDLKISVFGTSAKYIETCKDKHIPNENYHLTSLRSILSTGSPLIEECFDYVYENVKKDVLLGSISGGTDIISCFALSNSYSPWLEESYNVVV